MYLNTTSIKLIQAESTVQFDCSYQLLGPINIILVSEEENEVRARKKKQL